MGTVFVLFFTGSPEEPTPRVIGVYPSYALASEAEDNVLDSADKQGIGPYRSHLEITEQAVMPAPILDQTKLEIVITSPELGVRKTCRAITGDLSSAQLKTCLSDLAGEAHARAFDTLLS